MLDSKLIDKKISVKIRNKMKGKDVGEKIAILK